MAQDQQVKHDKIVEELNDEIYKLITTSNNYNCCNLIELKRIRTQLNIYIH